MATIKQYRPSFFEGFQDETVSFNTLEELLSIPWVDNFKNAFRKSFHRFSIESKDFKYTGTHNLMAEYESGKTWLVVGYINDTDIVKELPVWEPKYK